MPRMTNLETIREARGMSRNALAGAVGVSRTTIVKLEEGETEDPGYQLTMDIAGALMADHKDLFLPAGSEISLEVQESWEVQTA